MVDPIRLAEVVRSRMSRSQSVVSAFWIKVDGDREAYRRALLDRATEGAIVPLIVRGRLFENPNSVLNDLAHLIAENRPAFELGRRLTTGSDQLAIVLLARGELCVPQVSSPVLLPEWLPVAGGMVTHMTIEDLTWTADCPLNAADVQVEEICEHVFELEGVILTRLKEVHTSDHNAGNALLEFIRRGAPQVESYPEILADAEAFRSTVRNPTAFRPSVREGRSLTARFWHTAMSTSPEQLTRPSRALADALGLSKTLLSGFRGTLLSTIWRPSARDTNPSVMFCRNLLITISAACQFVTAAAHADSYASYPILLLRAVSFDLRTSMHEAQEVLSFLP